MDSVPNTPPGTDEVVAVFDSAGRPVGSAARSRVYAEGLWHASAGVARPIRRRPARLRAPTLGHQDGVRRSCTTAWRAGWSIREKPGGGREPGNWRRNSASPESTSPPSRRRRGTGTGRDCGCGATCSPTRRTADGPIVHQASEIASGWWWTPHELVTHLRDPQWPFVPDTRALLRGLPRHTGPLTPRRRLRGETRVRVPAAQVVRTAYRYWPVLDSVSMARLALAFLPVTSVRM